MRSMVTANATIRLIFDDAFLRNRLEEFQQELDVM